MPRRKLKRLLRHSGTLPFSTGQREIRFGRFQPSGTFGPDSRQPGRPNWMRQTAMPPSVADPTSWRSSAADLRWASQQSGGFDWDFGSGALQPSTKEYDGFYRLEADNGRYSPQPKGGRTAQKGSPPLPYTSLQAALRLHPCRALSSAEAGMSLYPAMGRAQRRHDITAR
jgi:hypothetical protein